MFLIPPPKGEGRREAPGWGYLCVAPPPVGCFARRHPPRLRGRDNNHSRAKSPSKLAATESFDSVSPEPAIS